MTKITYIAMEEEHLLAVKKFTDQWIGKDYFDFQELKEIYQMSLLKDRNCSFCAFDNDKLVGVRLSFAPGNWEGSFGPDDLSFNDWGIKKESVAYFKSLFIDGDYQRNGIGRTLSNYSLRSLQNMGAKGVLCHSWLESPGGSSQSYLKKLGFKPIKTHLKFWYDIDYLCTRCNPERCICSAVEMLYVF